MLEYTFQNENKLTDDVCLVRSTRKLTNVNGTEAICLPGSDFDLINGEECFTAGWGKKYYGGGVNVQLTEVGLPIVDPRTCSEW